MTEQSIRFLTENERILTEIPEGKTPAEKYPDLLVYELECVLSALTVCNRLLNELVALDHPCLPREDELASHFKRMYETQSEICKILRKFTSFNQLESSIPLFDALMNTRWKISKTEPKLKKLQEENELLEEQYEQMMKEIVTLRGKLEENQEKIVVAQSEKRNLEAITYGAP